MTGKLLLTFLFCAPLIGVNTKFEFFKFGEINVNDIKVEPHFIVQSNKFRKDSESEVDSFEKSFNEVLEATTISDESSYEKLFNSMVREHMNLLKKNSP